MLVGQFQSSALGGVPRESLCFLQAEVLGGFVNLYKH